MKFAVILFLTLASSSLCQAQPPTKYSLEFKQGEIRHVGIKETLKLMMHFPQVEPALAQPSIRESDYAFTERVEKVNRDGSAQIAATLDSFVTVITIGEGKSAQEFFRFNSANDYDVRRNLHDIKTLPRAQFLGQTLHFTMMPDGTVEDIANLQAFHDAAVGKGYDYDMVHAILSLSDSLRIGQLLELGGAGLAGLNRTYTSASTAAEIHVTRDVKAVAKSNVVQFKERYYDAPKNIDYLEGIATPMGINSFNGGGTGTIVLKNHFLSHSEYRDTGNVNLQIDIDKVPEEITRHVVTDIYPIDVMHGSAITIKETKEHRAMPKDPLKEARKGASVIDAATGKVTPPSQVEK